MPTKHEMIIQHIDDLAVGEKVSVRSIAKKMRISEGTAYRAIKEAENRGLVSTIDRVGTVRIERKTQRHFDKLTFEEVVRITEGQVLGGREGMVKHLDKFVIGAMQEDAMLRYITVNSLMIVGNRISVQRLALESGAAVLITGGFETTQEMIDLADEVGLPIITTSYDTFTVATLINRAMSDQLIKKEIVLVDSVYTPLDQTNYLTMDDTVLVYRELSQQTDHSRFPVVNQQGRLVGIVTSKDVMRKSDEIVIEKVMTKSPVVAKLHMSIASISHRMIWDGLDILPVVADNMQLLGVISRRDVLKAIQVAQRQPQIGNTIKDQVVSSLSEGIITDKAMSYAYHIEPQMLNSMGAVSYGVLCEIVAETSKRAVYQLNQQSVILETLQLHYFKMIQNDWDITIQCDVLYTNRRVAKVDVVISHDTQLVAKAMVSYQMMTMI